MSRESIPSRRVPFFLLAVLLLACSLFSAPTAAPQPGAPAATQPPASELPPPPSATAIPPTPTVVPPTETPPSPAAFPDTATYRWMEVFSGLDSPVDIQFPNDGTGRMFIVEQPGRIRVVENGQLLDTPFLDITGRVNSSGNEQGLLGLAFHPDFKENGFFYVNYTRRGGATVIARFKADGNTANPDSETKIMGVDQPFPNHNGGQLAFGSDGYLYIGLGDGGSAGDPLGNGQSLNTLLGKILRIDVNNGDPYSIPADNPFAAGGAGYKEIWDFGLRNPWRFSFDRATGDMYIGDVGQDSWEEIDYVPAGQSGLNFGWRYYEGRHKFLVDIPSGLHATSPVAEYGHFFGCSVTGGYVYRGAMPEWNGVYLFGDFCSGRIWGLLRSGDSFQFSPLFQISFSLTTFGQDTAGELYLADRRGSVYKLGR